MLMRAETDSALFTNTKKALKVLLDHGADINILSADGYAPLHEAAASPSRTGLLVDYGADPKLEKPNNGCQPLHLAARAGKADVCNLLISAGADINAASKDGLTPLHEAAQHAQAEIVELLIAASAACMAEDKQHKTPLSAALTTTFGPAARPASFADDKLVATVSGLLSHGAGTRFRKQAWPELAEAASAGHAAVVQLLINEGAPASSEALAAAAVWPAGGCQHEVVVTLLGRGADPKAQDKGGFIPHHDAASKGQLKTIRVLLQDKRTPVNEGVHDGLTALHLAASDDKEGVTKLLIGFGADVEKRSTVDGRTALHYAARWASQNAASALLAASASFTTVDNSGKTPLHLAVAAPVQEVDELHRSLCTPTMW
ncbi:hypothetical protein WJX77_007343 [Trebouxia sp. C0004]